MIGLEAGEDVWAPRTVTLFKPHLRVMDLGGETLGDC